MFVRILFSFLSLFGSPLTSTNCLLVLGSTIKNKQQEKHLPIYFILIQNILMWVKSHLGVLRVKSEDVRAHKDKSVIY